MVNWQHTTNSYRVFYNESPQLGIYDPLYPYPEEFDLLDEVAVVCDVPAQELKAGAEGNIVRIVGNQYEVEFLSPDGESVSVGMLYKDQLRRTHTDYNAVLARLLRS